MSKSRLGRIVVVLACLLGFTGLAVADTRGEIEALAKQWESKFNSGDAAGVAAMYAEDAQLLPPESDFVSGRAAIQQFWQGALDADSGTLKFELLEVHGGGDTATEIGRYRMANAEGQQVDHGKYIVVWKKVGGTWLLYRDMWSSSVAPPPAPTPAPSQ